MKKASLVVILVVCAGLAWLYARSPASKIEYSFTEKTTGKFKDRMQPVRFALISDIHVREKSRQEITDEKQTRAILAAFMASMNDDVEPDFIVQLGDLNDGCRATCGGGMDDDLIIDRLQRAQQYTEAQTNISWFDVIGNHEYASAYEVDGSLVENKDFSTIYKAINEDWSRLEDTWYYRDIKGYRFIFLNTAFPYAGASHLAPEKQVEWLAQVLESSSQPSFVFMHVPVSDGSGVAYDVAINQEKISRLLAANDSFVLGFFGHSHHSDKWDGLRRQLDAAGNIYFHVPAPHQWLGDRSGHPWVIVTVEPDEDGITVEVGTGVERSELIEFVYYLQERAVKITSRLLANLTR